MTMFPISDLKFVEGELISTQSINKRFNKLYSFLLSIISSKTVTVKEATTTDLGLVKIAEAVDSDSPPLSCVTFDTLHHNTTKPFLYGLYNTTLSTPKTTTTDYYSITSQHSELGNNFILATGEITWKHHINLVDDNYDYVLIEDVSTQILDNTFTSYDILFTKVGTSGKHPMLLGHPTIFQNTSNTLKISISPKSYTTDITLPFIMIARGIR